MISLRKAILISALLVTSTPAMAEDAHHTNTAAGTTTPSTIAQPGMTGPGMMGSGMMGSGMMGSGMMGSGMMGPGMMGMMGMMKSMSQMMDPVHIEGRIAFLRTELRITDAQQPLWKAYADVMRKTTHDQQAMMQKMQMGMMSTQTPAQENLLQQMDRHEQMMSARLDQLRQMKAALEPLYDALDADQKHIADEILMPHGMGSM